MNIEEREDNYIEQFWKGVNFVGDKLTKINDELLCKNFNHIVKIEAEIGLDSCNLIAKMVYKNPLIQNSYPIASLRVEEKHFSLAKMQENEKYLDICKQWIKTIERYAHVANMRKSSPAIQSLFERFIGVHNEEYLCYSSYFFSHIKEDKRFHQEILFNEFIGDVGNIMNEDIYSHKKTSGNVVEVDKLQNMVVVKKEGYSLYNRPSAKYFAAKYYVTLFNPTDGTMIEKKVF